MMTNPFEPTAEQRRLARGMSGLGLPQEQIALLLEIDPKTLRKYFRDDLDRGMAEANVKIAQSLFNMATTGGSVAAAIFWMKARAGWREKHDVTVKTDSLEHYTDAELQQMIEAISESLAEAEAREAASPAIGRTTALIEAE